MTLVRPKREAKADNQPLRRIPLAICVACRRTLNRSSALIGANFYISEDPRGLAVKRGSGIGTEKPVTVSRETVAI